MDALRRLTAETMLVTDKRNREALSRDAHAICLPLKFPPKSAARPEDLYTPIPYIIPAQLFSLILFGKLSASLWCILVIWQLPRKRSARA
jgi:hypothetical protein